ncbi:MAG: hypothetical protein K6G52_04610, partial [Treponemataceae bacterium]|nr:hypothetical protein [Treponemataceae bacterium]
KLEEFLELGFDLRTICRAIDFNSSKRNDNSYEAFIKTVLDTKLYLKEKDTDDWLEIDQDTEQPYSIYTYFAQFAFAGAKNHKVTVYLPIEEVRKILIEELKDFPDTEKIINDYLDKEKVSEKKDDSELLTEVLDSAADKIAKKEKDFDIPEPDNLLFYSKGNTIETNLQKNLLGYFEFMEGALKEDMFTTLMSKSSQERCEFIIKQNRSLLIRDCDWKKIFKDIKTNKESYRRYYPAIRVSITSDAVGAVVRALIINDELYDFVYSCVHKDEKQQ